MKHSIESSPRKWAVIAAREANSKKLRCLYSTVMILILGYLELIKFERSAARRFRSSRKGNLMGQFFVIRQETTVEAYRSLLLRGMAPLPQLTDKVVKNTYMNGLDPLIKAEIECWRPRA